MSVKQKLKILHINTHDMAGGAAKVAWRLMEAQRSAGHDSKILAGIKESGSVNTYSFPAEADRSIQARCQREGQLFYEYQGSHKLVKHRLVKAADLLHLHNLHGGYFNPFSLSALSHIKPLIWTLHDMQSITGHCAHSLYCERWGEGCGSCPFLNTEPAIPIDTSSQLLRDKKLIYDHSYMRVVTPSQWLKDKVEKGILKDHPVELIYNGIDTGVFQPHDKKEVRRKYNVPDNVFVIGAVGHGGALNNQWKGGRYTQAALDILKRRLPGIIFVNIGANEQSDDPGIINIPHTSNEQELAEAYSLLDIFLYTPVADNCPLVILEAMSCGVPVVTFNTGGIPELVRDGMDGYVSEFNDMQGLIRSVERLAGSPELRTRSSRNARERAKEKFDHSIISAQYQGLYEKCLSEDNSASKKARLFHLSDVPDIIRTNAFFEAEKAKVEAAVTPFPEQGNIDEALLIVTRAIEQYPEYPSMHNYLAELKYLAGHQAEAGKIFQNIIKQWPSYTGAYNNLGVMCWEAGDTKGALKYFTRALKSDSNDRETILNCAKILTAIGQYEDAERLCSSFLRMFPADEEVSQLLTGALLLETENSEDGQPLATAPLNGHSGKIDVSIVLATKDRAALLDAMLTSLKGAAQDINYEVVIIEGGSTDNTMEILRRHGIDRVYSEREHLGEGRHAWPELYNFGFSLAGGRWAMFASDDIIFNKGCLSNAVRSLNDQGPEIAGGIFFYRNAIAEPGWERYGIDFTCGQKLLLNYGLVNLNCFRDVGGLDEDYKFYCADGDLCYKLYESGKQLVPLPGCSVVHNNVPDVQRKLNKDGSSSDIALYLRKWEGLIFNETIEPRRLFWEKDFCDAFALPLSLKERKSRIEYFWHGLAYFQHGLFREAKLEFLRINNSARSDRQVLWYTAKAAYECGDWELAKKTALAVLALMPDFMEARNLLGQTVIREGHVSIPDTREMMGTNDKGDNRDDGGVKDIQIYDESPPADGVGFDNSDPKTNGEYTLIQKAIKSGDVVFDIGANSGGWSKYVLSTVWPLHIYAFEPNPDMFNIVKSALSDLGTSLHYIAISDRNEEREFFYYDRKSNVTEMSSFYRRSGVEKELDIQPVPIPVQTRTLDSFCKEHSISQIDFLKIDTEGGELDVLRGAVNLLGESRIKKLQFEYGGTYADAGTTLRQAYELLSSYGYVVYRIVNDGLVHIAQWRDSLENYRYSNYLAISSQVTGGHKTLKTEMDHCVSDLTDSGKEAVISSKSNMLSQIMVKGLWSSDKPLRLHLGCGERHLDGYINIDYPPGEHSVQATQAADVFADISRLNFPAECIDEIRLHHVFEHFDYPSALAMLCMWRQWLKRGGRLVIETPDLEASMELLRSGHCSYKQKQSVLRHLFGSHEARWAVHRDGWDREKFQHVLTELGYDDLEFEFSEWEMTRNISVQAFKRGHAGMESLKWISNELLRDSMVDDTESEEKLWRLWCRNFEEALGNMDSDMAPAVSIFMPVYNSEKYLSQTIDSILAQTFQDFELIIADDGSTDSSLDIAGQYEAKDKRIRVLSLPHKGEVEARNEAIRHTHPGSRYLLNHDSDDISLPSKMEMLVKYLDAHPETAIVGCFAEYFDDEGNNKGQPSIEWQPQKIRKTFGQVNSMINSASMVRREVFNKIGHYREEYRSVDDYDFFARALMAGFELANIPEVLHRIRLHPASVGSTRAKTQEVLAKKIQETYNAALSRKNGDSKSLTKGKDQRVSGQHLRLHLGCGEIKVAGFINVDIDPKLPALDIVDDISRLERFNENSASVIYACHILEHFANDEVLPVLKRWREVLEPGGEIRISVPDIDRIVEIYSKNKKHFLTPPNTPWIGLIYGGQTDPYDFHKTGFNFTYLKYLMEQAGFINIEEYPHEPHWLGISADASMAKEPFKAFISLNIKAGKPENAVIDKRDRKRDKTLNILHTVEFYYPHLGGAESVVQQLSERLAKRGHRVTVATTKLKDRDFKELNGVRIEEFDIKGSLGNGLGGNDISKYKEFLLSHATDVMMNYAAQQWATDLAFDVIERTKKHRANIIAPCGYSALQDSSTIRWPRFAGYFNKVIPGILPHYDAAVYHSSLYKDYEFAQKLGIKNSVIIPNGVDEVEFSVRPQIDFREKYNIKTKYLGLCVANFYEGKGHERIIDCVRNMGRPDFTMVCIGKDGDRYSELVSLSSGLNIRFLKDISREDTVAAFHSADLFLFGSHIEASPLVIIEAKASRTPFISTDCGNVREWKGGIVCAPDEMAVNADKLLDNEAIRKQLAYEGWKEWKGKLTLEAVVDRYEELYMGLYQTKKNSNGKSVAYSKSASPDNPVETAPGGKNSLVGLIFSKDRAMQLDATLRSLSLHCKDIQDMDLKVIYKTSDNRYARQYQALMKENPSVEFIEEEDFKKQVLDALRPYKCVLFLVDDNIFVRDFSAGQVIRDLKLNPDSLGFSLRLGRNTINCYSLDKRQRLPEFEKVRSGALRFRWVGADLDFGYPLEVSSSVYPVNYILPLLEQLHFTNPNTLEEQMSQNANVYADLKPALLCNDASVTFCVPVNKVQTECDNRAGEMHYYPVEVMADKFDEGFRINVMKYADFIPDGCHQETPFEFQASAPCAAVKQEVK